MNKKQINDMLKAERVLAINNYIKIVGEKLKNVKYFNYLDKVCIICLLKDYAQEIIK